MSIFRFLIGVAFCGLIVGILGCKPQADQSAEITAAETTTSEKNDQEETAGSPIEMDFATTESQASYGLGYNIGRSLASRGSIDEIEPPAMLEGIVDGLSGETAQVDEGTIRAALAELEQRRQATQAKEATEWLALNAERPGVETTASGLQYEVIESGDGPSPTTSDTVEVHYHGTLTDGTVFDSSVQRGKTIEFPVSGVISGWTEALQLMQVGDKWRLFIPPHLGYGSRGTNSIPPNSALIFEVELIGVR